VGGPLVTVLGSIFAVLGMGMVSIHYALALFNITQEWLPAPASTVVVLPQRRCRLLFQPGIGWYRPPFSADLVYLGLRDGLPCLQLEIASRGQISRVTAAVNGRWEPFGPHGLDPGLGQVAVLQGTKIGLAIDILATKADEVQIRVHTPMRVSIRHAWEAQDWRPSALLDLPVAQRDLLHHMMHHPDGATLAELAAHTGQAVAEAQQALTPLLTEGAVVARRTGADTRYAARMAGSRSRPLSPRVQDVLDQVAAPPVQVGPPVQPGNSNVLRRLLARPRGRFAVGVTPVVLAFLMTEWAVISKSASFTSLFGFIGIAVVALLAGMFPVLLLIAARRKGEYVPQPTYRFLGNPLLLGIIYLLSLSGIAVHGLWIWRDPLAQAGALGVSVLGAGLPWVLWRRGLFARRLVVEVRSDFPPGPLPTVGVTANGQAATAAVRWAGGGAPGDAQTVPGTPGAAPDPREILIRPPWDARTAPADVKVWVHTITAAGDSVEWPAEITIHQEGVPDSPAAPAAPDGICIRPLAPAPSEVVIRLSAPESG
jgi:hypothetical protein